MSSVTQRLFSIVDRIEKIDDIKGAIATRNFIAHDYDGVNLSIIEAIIRERLPIVKSNIKNYLQTN